ncbi:hypothetical protein C0159_08230 [Moraxella catarrhalis]|uniref:Uncharacterized protein n=1 Tax=Moraxella catarrhalis TaxID=480 RepID=A0A3Q9GFW3_MORCA|nr:hypothetical protein [Moraxella catarrhalis]AZQ92340.1 hypothetical protein EJK53_1567 [Moraxella catarrhalis]AZQ93448.1 hypothetical protein EJK53_1641 [Moraxella catarrhalis]MDE4520042.1 hypothetical protein [Moraxella catarrhalis]MPX14476.1 hypothetical protein [Moraxella catarrhalis]MPX26395.1 hypothetical protein [Moraxella catarrhalis]
MTDKELIQRLGGAKVLGDYLSLKNPHQTVWNWGSRGIPAKVKLDYPELFQTDNPPNLNMVKKKNDQN